MSRSNLLIAGLTLSLGLVIVIGLFALIAIEREKIETQRRIQFEERASEIRTDIERRRELLKKKWEADRQQVIDEGIKLTSALYSGHDQERAYNQVGQWFKNLDAHYQSAEADLVIEETRKIAELRKQIWGK